MATMFDRLREGLIWSYAALSLVEERRADGRRWWEQENLRLKEEARARLDDTLRQLEERRSQRAEWVNQRAGWMRERVRAGLGESGIATSDQLTTLQERIDALAAQVSDLQQAQGVAQRPAGTATVSPIILSSGPHAPVDVLAAEGGAPTDATPTP